MPLELCGIDHIQHHDHSPYYRYFNTKPTPVVFFFCFLDVFSSMQCVCCFFRIILNLIVTFSKNEHGKVMQWQRDFCSITGIRSDLVQLYKQNGQIANDERKKHTNDRTTSFSSFGLWPQQLASQQSTDQFHVHTTRFIIIITDVGPVYWQPIDGYGYGYYRDNGAMHIDCF